MMLAPCCPAPAGLCDPEAVAEADVAAIVKALECGPPLK